MELAFIIGKKGKDIPLEQAMDYVFGYTVAHDVSARDWQLHKNGGQWLLGKAMDDFCPIGPEIVTSGELGDPHSLPIRFLYLFLLFLNVVKNAVKLSCIIENFKFQMPRQWRDKAKQQYCSNGS